jgi:hypothetical protein
MFARSLVWCVMCAVTLGCDRTEKTRSATELRMDADTVARTVDSLAIGGGSGPQALIAEPSMADTTVKLRRGRSLICRQAAALIRRQDPGRGRFLLSLPGAGSTSIAAVCYHKIGTAATLTGDKGGSHS